VNPKDKNVTVEIYGETVNDAQFGQVILKFSSKDLGTYGTPEMVYVYNTAKCPEDGKDIESGASYTFAEARLGQKAQTFKHILSLDGDELEVEGFTQFNWEPIKGKTYVNGPDPATVIPTPAPMPTPTPAPTETPDPEPDAES